MPGEGSVFRRKSDGRWVATVSTGPRGNRKIVTAYSRSKAEALAALADLRRAHGRLDRKTTVSDYLARWLHDADIRETTRRGYEAVIATHLDPTIGHLRLADLSPLDVRSMLVRLQGSAKTRRNVLVVLRRALREAVRSELIRRNPASPEYVDAPKVVTIEPDMLSWDETDRILGTADPEFHDLVVVALGSGLRQGEQIGLRWDDIDDGIIRVERGIVRIRGVSKPTAPKTARSRRSVPIGPDVQAALARQRERVTAAGFVPIGTGPVFIDAEGGVLTGSTLTHRWYRLLERAGVPRRPWKILRATYLSRLRDAGLDDADIARLAGHAPGSRTTRRHYIAPSGTDPSVAVTRTVTRTMPSADVAHRR